MILLALIAGMMPRLIIAGGHGSSHASSEEAHGEEHGGGTECGYFLADALDDAVDGASALAAAVASCSKGDGHCVNDILLTLSGFLESGAASLRSANCFQRVFGRGGCTADSLDVAGASLALGSEVKALVQGACSAHAHHRRLGEYVPPTFTAVTTATLPDESHGSSSLSSHGSSHGSSEYQTVPEGPGLDCVASASKMLLPLTKISLFFAFEASHCDLSKHPANAEVCMMVALEVVAMCSKIAGDIVMIIEDCGHPEGFNAHCGEAITEIVDEAADLTVAAMHMKATGCALDGNHRLFDADMPVVLEKRAMVDLVPWIVSGLLVFMIPIAYRAGKMQSRASRSSRVFSMDGVLAEEESRDSEPRPLVSVEPQD